MILEKRVANDFVGVIDQIAIEKRVADRCLVPIVAPDGFNAPIYAISIAMTAKSRIDADRKIDFANPQSTESGHFRALEQLVPRTGDDALYGPDIAILVANWNSSANIPKYEVYIRGDGVWHVTGPERKRNAKRNKVFTLFIEYKDQVWYGFSHKSYRPITLEKPTTPAEPATPTEPATADAASEDYEVQLAQYHVDLVQYKSEVDSIHQMIRDEYKLGSDDAITARHYRRFTLPEPPVEPLSRSYQPPTHAPEPPVENGEQQEGEQQEGEQQEGEQQEGEQQEEEVPEPPRIPISGVHEITKDHKLVVLRDRKFEEDYGDNIRRTGMFSCSFEVMFDGDPVAVGPVTVPDAKKAAGYVDCYFERTGIAPTFHIEVKWGLDTGSKHLDHKLGTGGRASIRFAFNPVVARVDGDDIVHREIIDWQMEKAEDGALITFKSEGGTPHDVYCHTAFSSHDRAVARPKAITMWMLKTLEKMSTTAFTIKIKVREGVKGKHARESGEVTEIDKILDRLPSPTDAEPKPQFQGLDFSTYLTAQGNPTVQFNQMISRASALRSPNPCLPLPAYMGLKDRKEAALILGMGVHLLGEETKMYINSVADHMHKVAIHRVGTLAFVVVKYTEPLASGIPDVEKENIQIPQGTEVALTITAGDETKESWRAKGVVISDTYKMHSDLLIIVNSAYAVDFAPLLSEAFTEPGDEFRVHVHPTPNETTIAYSLDAVATAYGATKKPDYPNFVAAMDRWNLIHFGKKLERVFPFADAEDEDPQAFELKVEKLKQGPGDTSNSAWNTAQAKAIDDFLAPRGGISLVTGPPGSGKTTLASKLAEFALDNGQKVLVTGSLNQSLDDACEKMHAVLERSGSDIIPIRAYSSTLENPLKPELTHTVEDDDKELFLFRALHDATDEFKARRRGKPDYSVEAKVRQNIGDPSREPLMGYFTNGLDEDKQPIIDGEQVDMHERLRYYLSLPFDGTLDEDEKRRFKQCLKICRCEVYQEARIIFCTVVVAGGREMRDFASDDQDKLYMIVDEATTFAEPMALIPLKTKYSPKIVGIFMTGDLEQLGPNPIASFSKGKRVNEFLDQMKVSLFERMIVCGRPVTRLTEQKRQHKILHDPVNDLHYGRANRTVEGLLTEDMKLHINLMRDFLGLGPDVPYNEFQKHLAWIEITDSIAEFAPNSNSTRNLGNVLWVTPRLQVLKNYFRGTVFQRCAIYVPYRAQYNEYKSLFLKLKRREGFTDNELPFLRTTDSSIGSERDFVLIDLTQVDKEGFLADEGRACVTWSRAKMWQVTVAGPMVSVDRLESTKYTKATYKQKAGIEYKVQCPIAYHSQYAHNNQCKYWFSSSGEQQEEPPTIGADEGPTDTEVTGEWATDAAAPADTTDGWDTSGAAADTAGWYDASSKGAEPYKNPEDEFHSGNIETW